MVSDPTPGTHPTARYDDGSGADPVQLHGLVGCSADMQIGQQRLCLIATPKLSRFPVVEFAVPYINLAGLDASSTSFSASSQSCISYPDAKFRCSAF